MTWNTPKTWADGTPVGAYDLNRDLSNNLMHLFYDAGAGRIQLYHDESTVTAGNAITTVTNGSQRFNLLSYQNPAAVNDQFTQSVVLGPGVYDLQCNGRATANSGIVEIALNGNSFIEMDAYSAGTVYNTFIVNGSFSVTEFGRYVLTWTVTGKNPASGGYAIEISEMYIYFPWTSGDL